MKSTPTIQNYTTPPTEISRLSAAIKLRMEHGRGKVIRFSQSGPVAYFLTTQDLVLMVPLAKKPRKISQPQPFALSKRLTYRYTDGWSSLDKWHEIGEAAVIARGKSREDDESYSQLQIVQVTTPRPYRPSNIARALETTMTSGCRCEHDCCGHYQNSPAKIRPLKNGYFAVLMSGNRNI